LVAAPVLVQKGAVALRPALYKQSAINLEEQAGHKKCVEERVLVS
jgi:hypothetical protein